MSDATIGVLLVFAVVIAYSVLQWHYIKRKLQKINFVTAVLIQNLAEFYGTDVGEERVLPQPMRRYVKEFQKQL